MKYGGILPMIHLNGSSREMLLSQQCAVVDALEAAYQSMKRAAPNGRDYYPLGPAALTQAITEHEDRLRRLDALKSEVERFAIAINEA